MPITYKCPGCGSVMEFDSASQMLKCTSCGTTIPVAEYENNYANHQIGNEGASQGSNSQKGNLGESMKIFRCQSCGAELLADEFTSATFCSYCGNSTLVENRLQGEFKPKTVIPFKINKTEAVEIYKDWLKKGALTPSMLSSSSTIEKISGVYVPFWLYNYGAESRMDAHAERIRRERKGNTEYIYTDHYNVYRDVVADFERIPADASEKMPDSDMDKLEPYDYKELTDFQFGYLSGYLSERYNYTADQIQDRAKSRAKQYITDIARDTITGYDNVSIVRNDVSIADRGNEYALFPVWMLNYRYNGKEMSFFLNGQTGKIVANRPISKLKALAYGVGIFAATLAITMIGGLFVL